MGKTATLNLRVPVEILERLDKLAAATDRTRSSLAASALSAYVENEEWQLKVVREGIRDLETGRVIRNEEVEAWLDTWGAEGELPPPTCE